MKKTVEKRLSLERHIVEKVDNFLYSNVEGQVPYGAWKKYLEELIEQDFRRRAFVVAEEGDPRNFETVLRTIENYIHRVANPEDLTFLTHRLRTLRLCYEIK